MIELQLYSGIGNHHSVLICCSLDSGIISEGSRVCGVRYMHGNRVRTVDIGSCQHRKSSSLAGEL